MSAHNYSGPTVSAVIITRHRPDMLQHTIQSLTQMVYPLAEIIVSDDSSNDSTMNMVASRYPGVKYIRGPQRGIAANRNNGIQLANSDYILMMDDDIAIQRNFLCLVLQGSHTGNKSVSFAAIRDGDSIYSPKNISYLGFHTREYGPGEPRKTLNSQAFVMPSTLRGEVLFDEAISLYGYEEVDFGYRVFKKGYEIKLVPNCVNVHTDPNGHVTEKRHVDASRLYVRYKKIALVDRRKVSALIYLCIAIPHLFVSTIRRRGFKGFAIAISDLRIALSSIRSHSAKISQN
jgi:GT2 family glycosyltransferase